MANLRGRAGRLLKDFIGRTYVLDESAFADADGYDQLELFEDVTKELPSGYGERFEEYREDIEDVIETNKTVDHSMKKYKCGFRITIFCAGILTPCIRVVVHTILFIFFSTIAFSKVLRTCIGSFP